MRIYNLNLERYRIKKLKLNFEKVSWWNGWNLSEEKYPQMKWYLECVLPVLTKYLLIIQVRFQSVKSFTDDSLEARALAEALRSVLFELLKYQMEINKVNELKKIARASISDGQAREQKLNNARLGELKL